MWRDRPARILIVDDHPKNGLALNVILEGMETIEVETACSGEEARARVASIDYALILLDLNMPGMDGFETAKRIRETPRSAETPIIFLTAFADILHEAEAYAHDAVDFIETPVIPAQLRSKVKLFADYSRMREELAERQPNS